MWNTTLGCRILKGDEARLVNSATLRLVDDIRNFIPRNENHSWRPQFGIPIFDQLTPEQQIVMLDTVIGYLLDPNLAPPKPNALLDATVAAIYAKAFVEVEVELDFQRLEDEAEDGDTDVRKLVVAALMQPIEEMDEVRTNCPDPECCVAETWLTCIEILREQVLADEDWLMGELTMDLLVDESDDIKQRMGINRDYFVAIPPDPTIAEVRQAWANMNFKIQGKRVATARFGDQRFELVKLSDIVDEMEMELDDWCSYVNKRAGKVVSVPFDSTTYFENGGDEEGEEYDGEADDDMLEEARQIVHDDHHVALPTKFDIHEWEIMRDFCVSRVKPDERDQLLESIHGSGAFRMFRSTLDRLGLIDEWHQFRDSAVGAIVMDWSDAHGIAWISDAEFRSIFRTPPDRSIDLDVDF